MCCDRCIVSPGSNMDDQDEIIDQLARLSRRLDYLTTIALCVMGVPGVSVGGVKPTGNHNTGTATCPRKQLSTTSSQPSITPMPRVTTPKQPSIMRPDNTKKPPITPTLQGDTRFMRGIIPTKLPRPTWTTMERSSRSMPSGVSSQESLGWRPLSFTRTVPVRGQIQPCSASSVAGASFDTLR